jgi:hypothetical protein
VGSEYESFEGLESDGFLRAEGGGGGDTEQAEKCKISEMFRPLSFGIITLFGSWSRFASKVGFLKRPPFERFTISATLHIPLPTLLACWLRLVALQSFSFARDASIAALALLGFCDSSILHPSRYRCLSRACEGSPVSVLGRRRIRQRTGVIDWRLSQES